MRKGKIQKHINDLGHLDTWKRISAAHALAEVGQVAVPALIDALKGENEDVRIRATYVLEDIGPDAKAAVPALTIEALKDENEYIREAAAGALGEIDAEAAVLAFIEALKDKHGEVRCNAAWALGEIGPDAKGAVPALTEALKDKDKYWAVRDIAAEALKRIKEK